MMDTTDLPSASWKITLGPHALLSFFLTRKEWSGWEAGDVAISVNGQVIATETVAEHDLMLLWRPAEVDLSRWSGQTITLSLDVHVKTPGAKIELPIGDPVVYAREQ
jgi:hypothetical protein